MSFFDMLNQYCKIEQVARTPDGKGGTTEVWSDYITNLRCRIRALNGREVDNLQKLEVNANFKCNIEPQELNITEKNHRLVFNDGFEDRIFDITHVDKWNFDNHHWTLALFEQKV